MHFAFSTENLCESLVNVEKSLKAKVSGASSVIYKGSPQVTKEISGAGSVTQG